MSNMWSIQTGLIIMIIIMINIVGTQFHLRFDFTEDKEYTLSRATRNLLKDIEDVVTVKAYFSENLPPDIARTHQEFQELLIEYNNQSNGMVAYDFINPNENEADEQEAIRNGIQPVVINVREKDQVKQQRGFLGAQLSFGGKKEIIPFIRPGASMEYALSTSIKKLIVKEKPVVGFLSGHGEAPLEELFEIKKSLEILYQVQEVPLSDSTEIPEAVQTLVIIRPNQTYSNQDLQKINTFLGQGKKLFIGLNRVHVDFEKGIGTPLSTGLESWLREKGLVINDDFVIDIKCGNINVQQQMAFGLFSQQVPFPYLPIISEFNSHPITQGLESVLLKFASTLQYVGDSTVRYTPIAFSSKKSGTLKAPQYFNYQKQWTEQDFPLSRLAIAGTLEGVLGDNSTPSKMVVMADGDFPVNGPSDQAQRLQPDNLNIFVNAIDWLSDDTGLISLRTKGATSRPIDQLEDSTKTGLKYGNFIFPIILAIGYGLVRMQRNKIKRFRWMSENYEKD